MSVFEYLFQINTRMTFAIIGSVFAASGVYNSILIATVSYVSLSFIVILLGRKFTVFSLQSSLKIRT